MLFQYDVEYLDEEEIDQNKVHLQNDRLLQEHIYKKELIDSKEEE
jgi:hypothetical protein